jgi:hypothetical protein
MQRDMKELDMFNEFAPRNQTSIKKCVSKPPMFGKSPVSLKLHVFADCINHSPQNGKVGHLETMRQRSHPDGF